MSQYPLYKPLLPGVFILPPLSREARERLVEAHIVRDPPVRHDNTVHRRQLLVRAARRRGPRGVQRLGRFGDDLAVREGVPVAAIAVPQGAPDGARGVDVLGGDAGVGGDVGVWVGEGRVAGCCRVSRGCGEWAGGNQWGDKELRTTAEGLWEAGVTAELG